MYDSRCWPLRGDRIPGSVKHEMPVTIREITLGKNHSWNRIQIEDIDISRQSYFVLIKRDNELLRPRDDLVLQEGDKAILLSRGKDRKLEREYDA